MIGEPRPYQVAHRRTPVLKACRCSAVFVGDPISRDCPACKRKADLRSSLASVRRLRAKRRPPLTQQCRQCGGPMSAKRSTKAFCSERCRVAAHRERLRGATDAPGRPFWIQPA
jgi:hypothetical protein